MRHALVLMIAACLAMAAGPARAADGGKLVILQPADGAVVTSPITVVVSTGTAGAGAGSAGGAMTGNTAMGGMAMNGMSMPPGAHAHLLIDSPVPQPGSPIPMDSHHRHLMHGETQVTLTLPAGKHTLQLVMGAPGHHVPVNPQVSPVVTITVK